MRIHIRFFLVIYVDNHLDFHLDLFNGDVCTTQICKLEVSLCSTKRDLIVKVDNFDRLEGCHTDEM